MKGWGWKQSIDEKEEKKHLAQKKKGVYLPSY
jgi:hypothetical protein